MFSRPTDAIDTRALAPHILDMQNPDMNSQSAPLDEVIDTFELLDDWEDRYRYLIELGGQLPPFPDEARTAANKVRGCVSQVWLISEPDKNAPGHIIFRGDSDAHIVRGLIALLLMIFSGKTAEEISRTDARAILDRLGLAKHLSPMRTNGLYSMVSRIGEIAKAAA